ncbi:uroporphyrinogen-III C-methyltransferase [Aeromicrobium sp.]|uniref:uroporphyrinogen-III C-methyltransferase n=1 Tax=Aeromicrobium sp. TaxID=1871063 RepID=UPI0025C19612|nr:uroporphyrinogen-III C-methyltransferase [Aeromicrobium sp.]MCK5890448.1 uroporphyrinogen-III C-methyltransferase [Aeromicrobium sp.]
MTTLTITPGSRVLVTAGDPRTASRVETLLGAGAAVTVVAPEVCATIEDWHLRGLLTWEPREATLDDVRAADLVVNAVAAAAAAPGPAATRGPGTVTLVGGGPSDPGLLTVAGHAALLAADVVVTDRLAPLAALEALPPHVEIIDVAKIPHGRSTSQEDINRVLVEQALAGRDVVRLKGGDPFVFGRGGEELDACHAAGVPTRVLPGVTSAIAAPELAGIPVTHRGLTQGFTVVSGHVPPGHPDSTVDWSALARSGTTIVVLMGVRTLPAIAAALVAGGLDPATPAAVVADAGRSSQQVVRGTVTTIETLARDAGIGAPAVVVVGAVAARGADRPAEQRPVHA